MAEKKPEDMKEFFDSRSSDYDKHMQENVSSFEKFYKKIAEPISPTENPVKILVLGCGTGLELEEIFKKVPGAFITGIDLSGEMLEKLREKYKAFSEQINLIRGNYLEEDFGLDCYDCAVSVMTVHHLLPGPKENLYRKILNSLRPGGKYIEGDYYVTPEKEKKYLEEYKALDDEGRGRYHIDIPFSPETQHRLLIQAGFTEVEFLWEEGDSGIIVGYKE